MATNISIDIEEALKELNSLPKEEKEKINAQVQNRCYDREYCAAHGINYCNITNRDIHKLAAIIYLENKAVEIVKQH